MESALYQSILNTLKRGSKPSDLLHRQILETKNPPHNEVDDQTRHTVTGWLRFLGVGLGDP